MHCRTWYQNRAEGTSDVGGRQGSQSSSPPLAPVAQLQTFWGLWGHMCRLLSAYRTSSDAWCSQSLDSLRELSNLCCVLSLEKLKTFETKAAWSPSVASLGYACSGLRTTCLALQTLLYHSLFFTKRKIFSIINHGSEGSLNHLHEKGILSWPRTKGTRQQKQPVPMVRRGEGLPGTFKVRVFERYICFGEKGKGSRTEQWYHLLQGDSSKPRYRFFFMTVILKGNS